MRQEIQDVLDEISKEIVGKDPEKKIVLAAIFSRGHILLEDIPGVGKTSLALAISKTLGLHQNRMQFTPDVLPADVVGFHIIGRDGEMEYKEGVLSCNLFLADEINRTSAKTQSALLEVMAEGQVTVDGITKEVPRPFIVIATENPVGSIGTQMLPESQLDRFLISLSMGYPSHENEVEILRRRKKKKSADLSTILERERILEIMDEVEDTHVTGEVYDYVVNLAEATRNHPWLELGLSPRGTLALMHISQSLAWMEGRDYVLPEDVKTAFPFVAGHRVVFHTKARISQKGPEQLMEDIFQKVRLPRVVNIR